MQDEGAAPRTPTVFVGIPTFNRPRYVREAILSVLAQTHVDLRLVVSDNDSLPEAAADVRGFVAGLDDPRVICHLQPRNGGEYGQGRFLIGQCDADYFVMLHDDDRFEPDYLSFAVRILESDPELAFLSTAQRAIDDGGRFLPELTRERNEGEGRNRLREGRLDDVLEIFMRHGGVFSISGTVFRTAAVRRAGLVDPDCEGLYPFEYNVFLRQAETGAPAYYSHRQFVSYRYHAGTMRNYARPFFNRRMMKTLMTLLERRRFAGKPERYRRRLLGAVYRNYAYILQVAGDPAGCLRYLASALRLYPFSPKTWLYASLRLVFPWAIQPLWRRRVTL